MRRFIQDAVEHQAGQVHMDAGETAFFIRELETIEARTYDIKYPDLKARLLLSMGSGLSPAAEYLTWRQFDRQGQVEEASMDSDNLPMVDVKGREFQSRVVPIVVAYDYNVQDIRAAMMAGRPLDAMKAFAAREVVERKIEKMAAVGSDFVALNSVYGLLNSPDVPLITTVAVGTTTSGYAPLALGAGTGTPATWGLDGSSHSKTPKEIVKDLNAFFQSVQSATNGVEAPDTLLLDLKSYNYINTTQMNDADTSIFVEGTILQYIMRNCAWLKSVDMWLFCGKAGTGTGPGSTGTEKSRAMLYKKSPENFSLFIPQEFEQFAPQLNNFKFKIPCHARCAGVVTRYPRSAVYIDGLTA